MLAIAMEEHAQDLMIWAFGLLMAVAAPWGIYITWSLKTLLRESSTNAHKHSNADEYGFGTVKTNQLIDNNTRATEALTHYLKWHTKHVTGIEPPPPEPGD